MLCTEINLLFFCQFLLLAILERARQEGLTPVKLRAISQVSMLVMPPFGVYALICWLLFIIPTSRVDADCGAFQVNFESGASWLFPTTQDCSQSACQPYNTWSPVISDVVRKSNYLFTILLLYHSFFSFCCNFFFFNFNSMRLCMHLISRCSA